MGAVTVIGDGPRRGVGVGQRPAALRAIEDFLFAAWFWWMTPLLTALSSLTEAAYRAVLGLVGVAGVGGLAELADRRLDLGLDRLVALGRDAVGLDPLELGLDVRHWFLCFLWGRCAVEGGSRTSGPGVGTPVVDARWVVLSCAHDLKRARKGQSYQRGERGPKRRTPGCRGGHARLRACCPVIVRTQRSTA